MRRRWPWMRDGRCYSTRRNCWRRRTMRELPSKHSRRRARKLHLKRVQQEKGTDKLSDKAIRVGVIGVGDFGRNHVRVLHELAGAELVGLHDADPERARQVAAEFGTDAFTDFDQLAEQIDAACVAAPTVSHAKISTRLLERGVDVLVE